MRRGIVVLLLLLVSTPALAKKHHKPPFQASTSRHYHHAYYRGARYRYHVSRIGLGRPRAWCGWYMRTLKGGGPEYNLARNWAHYGHATGPHIGVVVVWSHHVGIIVGGSPGSWVIKSGNDGHAVRERVRSVSGAIAFRE